jgi:hypothetical protein
MRRFNVHCVTEIDFVDGDAVSDAVVQNYQKRLAETVQDAAHNLSLRTLKGARVERVVVEEIRGGPPTPAAQMDVMDERFDLKTVNVKLREAITNCLENADDTTRKNDEAIADTQPDDPDDKDEHDNLQLRKQALIEAGVWNDAS